MVANTVSRSKIGTTDLVYIGIFAALITVCSWISINLVVPFTLQTFAIFLAVYLLGGRRGTVSVLVYILLGAVGLPVFSGFSGGIGRLLGTTGGYIIGFLFSALVMWAFETFFGKNFRTYAISMVVGLIVCYAFGTAWYMIVYTRDSGITGIMVVLGKCVFPFIIPDLIKISLALAIGNNKNIRRVIVN